MELGSNTKAFFNTLMQQEKSAPAPLAITADNLPQIRELTKQTFQDYAGEFPKGTSSSSFVNQSFLLNDNQNVHTKIYAPDTYDSSMDASVIFFQGNGFLFDMLAAHLPGFARLAITANCQVIGIDTPLAPEHTAEEINDLSYQAVAYIVAHADELNINPHNIILAGYSGGANIAINIAHKARNDSKINLKHLMLVSPSIDLTFETRKHTPYTKYQDMDESANIDSVKAVVKLYHKNINPALPLISPMFHKDLTDMPKTTIIVAEFDAARGDAHAFLDKLNAANVPADIHVCEGQTHNYFIARGVMDDPPDPAIVMAQAILKLS